MMRMRVLAAGLGVLLVACGGNRGSDAPSPSVLAGIIRVVGSDPTTQVVLRREGQRDVPLTGYLRQELRQLDGARVTLEGVAEETGPANGFAVDGYRIDEMSGQRPVVGLLVERDGRFWIDGEEMVRLASLPTGLRAGLGGKVWVVGLLVDGALQVQSFGILRTP